MPKGDLQKEWKALLRGTESEAFLCELQLDHVTVHANDGSMDVQLFADRLFLQNEIACLQKDFARQLLNKRIKVWLTYPALSQDVVLNITKYQSFIVQQLKTVFSTIDVWLNESRWTMNEQTLEVLITKQPVLDLLENKKVDKYLKELLSSLFNIDRKVCFKFNQNPNNSPQAIFARREEEQRQIMNEATALVPSVPKIKASKQNIGAIIGKPITSQPVPMDSLMEESGQVTVSGEIFNIERKETKGSRSRAIYSIDVTDYTSSITAVCFVQQKEDDVIQKTLECGSMILLKGEFSYDDFRKEMTLRIRDMQCIENPIRRQDLVEKKRVELHMHTQMSALDAVASVKGIFDLAKKMGHEAVAITDHGVLQAYPEVIKEAKKNDIKPIYGIEAYLIDDIVPVVMRANDKDLGQTFVVFDVETTGISPAEERITEIGAVKIQGGEILESFSTLVNPEKPIPEEVIRLTGITDEMVSNAKSEQVALQAFLDFCGDIPLVAHNASFDMGFLYAAGHRHQLPINMPVVDTLALSRQLFPELKAHKLATLVKTLDIKLDHHHRALHDATATAKVFAIMLEMLKKRGVTLLGEINTAFVEHVNLNAAEVHHAVILARSTKGLKDLYRLVSDAHLKYFYKRPRILKSELQRCKEGFLIGSACEKGELFRAIMQRESHARIEEIAAFYDYFEIQPDGNNAFLIRNGAIADIKALHEINMQIIELGEKMEKKVIATGDVHFLNPCDAKFREVLMTAQDYEDAHEQAPLFYRTTEEMLEEFEYVGKEKAYEIVVQNTREIAELIPLLQPIPSGLYTPQIEGADDELRQSSLNQAHQIYGNPLPDIVQKRLLRELDSIINNQYATLYLIAQKLVAKSLQDGYLVGSRGSVGSSFAATMAGITEINPLPPHYVCGKCKYSDFEIDLEKYDCGIDMPDKNCPVCGEKLKKDGFDIPFEVFMGFEGDKVPDIDLNFSGVYQQIAHKYIEELFGVEHVFRAGTISTIAEKTAFGYVKAYMDKRNLRLTSAEMRRLAQGCTGVKRTTGQHPGGIIIVPKDKDIYEFTPVQHPANDKISEIITTHFDFHSIHDHLVKVDALGHDAPTVIRLLQDYTGIEPKDIPIDDPGIIKLFSSVETLGIKPEDIGGCSTGANGLPDLGTKFIRQILLETKPTTINEVIRVIGLSHGEDVWLNNAQVLIQEGKATLPEAICNRDDIMNYLVRKMKNKDAFDIMESVRKGKGLQIKGVDMEKKMREAYVPEWYIESCKRIKYMFPKAHAAAYVVMALRMAYFKVYIPKAFYAAYYSTRVSDFGAEVFLDKQNVRNKIRELQQKGRTMSQKESARLTLLEMVEEMLARNIHFVPVDIYRSDDSRFIIEDEGIRPPLCALEGLGENAARNIVRARKEGKFISIEDMQMRARISKTVVEILDQYGCLKNMAITSQVSLF